jgi:hypothetical protein
MTTLDLRTEARAHAPLLNDPGALREIAMNTWRARMKNEYASHRVFLELAAQLKSAVFTDDLQNACLQFAAEEKNHGVLCGAVVESLGGEAITTLPDEEMFPQHLAVSRRAAALRNVISICCMSETVAVALIGAERIEMPASPLRDLLTRIYADEVGHARFGWKLLHAVAADLSAEDRHAIDIYLPIALAHLEAHELAHLPARGAPIGGEAFGVCSGNDARELLYDTIHQVIVPQLRALGFSFGDPRARETVPDRAELAGFRIEQ